MFRSVLRAGKWNKKTCNKLIFSIYILKSGTKNHLVEQKWNKRALK